MLGQVVRLAQLQHGWDSYGSPSPSPESVAIAAVIVTASFDANLPPTAVVPSAEGGVGIVYRRDGKHADIECFNDGEIVALTAHQDGPPHTWTVSPDEIDSTIRSIRDFFAGCVVADK